MCHLHRNVDVLGVSSFQLKSLADHVFHFVAYMTEGGIGKSNNGV